jgi:DNA-binding LacI/PurR family transcriptional regulator
MDEEIEVKRMVTIKDVARLSGVAPSTVSKVINSTGTITLETKRRVENAIHKLNYRPIQLLGVSGATKRLPSA